MYENLVIRKIKDKILVVNIATNDIYEIDELYCFIIESLKFDLKNVKQETMKKFNISENKFNEIKKEIDRVL